MPKNFRIVQNNLSSVHYKGCWLQMNMGNASQSPKTSKILAVPNIHIVNIHRLLHLIWISFLYRYTPFDYSKNAWKNRVLRPATVNILEVLPTQCPLPLSGYRRAYVTQILWLPFTYGSHVDVSGSSENVLQETFPIRLQVSMHYLPCRGML